MAGANSSGSPLEAITETVGERTTEAFEILGNETRLAILLTLWEAEDPGPPFSEPSDPTISFSELRRRVGMPDSGQFNYHLDKLVGPFVKQTDNGYALTRRAHQILHAVLAGTLAEQSSFEGESIDAECFRCGGPTVIDYDDHLLTVRCTECEGMWQSPDYPSGTIISASRPPIGLKDRTPQEFFWSGNTRDRHRHFSMIEGVCPDCSGMVSITYHVCEDHDTHDGTVCEHCGSLYEIQSVFVCEVCKHTSTTPAWAPIFTEMAVKVFFYEHRLDIDALFEKLSWGAIHDAIKELTVRSEEPLEIGVAVELDGDRLKVTLDDQARVVDVIEEG